MLLKFLFILVVSRWGKKGGGAWKDRSHDSNTLELCSEEVWGGGGDWSSADLLVSHDNTDCDVS